MYGLSLIHIDAKEISGVIEVISPVVIEGNTHYYICLQGQDDIFDVNVSDQNLTGIIRAKEGDRIKMLYEEGYGLNQVVSFE